MSPAPARHDGEPTTVGMLPCVCSRTAWLSSRRDGETYSDYTVRMNAEFPIKPTRRTHRPHEVRGSDASNSCYGAL